VSALQTGDNNIIQTSPTGNLTIVWTEVIFKVTINYSCKELNVIPNVIKINTDGNKSKILMEAKNILNKP
jgi:hypothetical protein